MTSPENASEGPDDAVWQEYEISVLGDVMSSLTVLLPAVAAGCGISLLLLALAQLGLVPMLDPWVPRGADGLLESAYPVAILLGGAALALTVIPGELSSWSVQRTLLRAVRQRAPRTRVPHPVQSEKMVARSLTCAGGIVALLGLVATAIVLLVRFVSGAFGGTDLLLTGITAAGAAVLALAWTSFEQRRKKRVPSGPGTTARTPRQIVEAHWPSRFSGSVRRRAAQAAGYAPYGDARRMLRGQEPRRGSVTPAAAAPPDKLGGHAPEWARRDRPRQIEWLLRIRALLAILAFSPLLAHRYPWYEIDPVVAVCVLAVLALLLIAHLLLIVARRRERAGVVRASRDPSAPRPSEGPLTRHNAERTLESAWVGALLVGIIAPFMLVLRRDIETFFPGASHLPDQVLWGCGAVIVLCVLAQTLEAHVGRRTRNRIMARWPSLWHSKELPG